MSVTGSDPALTPVGRERTGPDRAGVYLYRWGNNPRRAELRGRTCVVEARGTLGTVLVRFLDTGERVTTSGRALRRAEPRK